MPVLSTTQLQLEFEAGLATQADTLKEFIREVALPDVARNGKPKKHVAADMDLSPSELTRKLSENPNDPRNFNTEDIEAYLAATRDMAPIYYLLDKFGPSPADRIADLEAELARLKSVRGVA